MLTDLRGKLDALIVAHDQTAAQHRDALAAVLAEVDAEIARVPTLDDVSALIERVKAKA
ncbi:MAG: hypothetical protein ACREDH_15580 [Methylocella sp.]